MENKKVQEIEQKKRQLKRYKKNSACVARLENKLRLLDDRIKTVKTPVLSGMPRGGVPVSIEDLLSDKMELEERIKRLKKKGRTLKTGLLEEIDLLEDPLQCEVMEAFLIDGLSIDDIAENMGYSPRHIYRVYSEAVAYLTYQ